MPIIPIIQSVYYSETFSSCWRNKLRYSAVNLSWKPVRANNQIYHCSLAHLFSNFVLVLLYISSHPSKYMNTEIMPSSVCVNEDQTGSFVHFPLFISVGTPGLSLILPDLSKTVHSARSAHFGTAHFGTDPLQYYVLVPMWALHIGSGTEVGW